jgi:hypothetical protein
MKLRSNLAISESGFLFDAGTGESFSLNPTGYAILELLRKGQSDAEVKAWVLERYDVNPSDFERLYFDFVRSLHQYGFFEKD